MHHLCATLTIAFSSTRAVLVCSVQSAGCEHLLLQAAALILRWKSNDQDVRAHVAHLGLDEAFLLHERRPLCAFPLPLADSAAQHLDLLHHL